MRRRISFEESCARECALQLTGCGGPTVHGVDGYACENCLAFIVAQFERGENLGMERCGYCGSSPTYAGVRGVPVCGSCSRRALDTARWWYTTK